MLTAALCHQARGDDRVAWLTGPALERALEATAGVTWSGMPLRDGLHGLSESHRVAMLLDRRVDPGQPVELAVRDQSLRACFELIAAEGRLSASCVGPVAYIGPSETVDRLRTVAALRRQDVAGLPAAARKAWVRSKTWTWPDLATPRELLEALSREGQFELAGLETIPHDLWAGADLPAMTLADRLTLLLAAYHATYELDESGRHAAIRPIPDDVRIEQSFPGGARPDALAEEWRTLLPECEIEVSGRKITVRGRVEELERINVARQGTAVKTAVAGPVERRYTLTVKSQPLSAVLPQLAEALDVEFKIDEEALAKADVKLDGRVSFSVKEATLDELLEAALSAAGLTAIRQGKLVNVVPRPVRP
jgi:hypothetical protein